jgi:hypothetical protein
VSAPAAFLRVLAEKLRDAAAVLAANRETLDLDYLRKQALDLGVDDLLGQLLG